MTKCTKQTFKSFINKNKDNLMIRVTSRLDPMTDGLDYTPDDTFSPIVEDNVHTDYTYGIAGAWLVGRGGDKFHPYDDGIYKGIRVHNSCGSFVLAVLDVGPPLVEDEPTTRMWITDKNNGKHFNVVCSTKYKQHEIHNLQRHIHMAKERPWIYKFLDVATARIVQQ